MTAVINRERAKPTCFTAAAGFLILAAAFVMMACAAPSLMHARSHDAVAQAARVYTSSVITESSLVIPVTGGGVERTTAERHADGAGGRARALEQARAGIGGAQ